MKIIFSCLLVLSSIPAMANKLVLECDDEREADLVTVLYVGKNWEQTPSKKDVKAIEIYQGGQLVDSERGYFKHTGCVEEGVESVQCEFEFYREGEKKSLGTLTLNEEKVGRISMQLMDRQFHGNCYFKDFKHEHNHKHH